MKNIIKSLAVVALGAAVIQSCSIDDEYTYGKGLYAIDWQAAADSSTTALTSRFWNTSTHYFVYNADEFSNGQDPGYWPQAHAMDVIIDAYVRTGDTKYSDMFGQWYEGIKAVNFSNRNQGYRNDYYDDSEWIGLTMMRLYEVTNDSKYLTTAKDLFEWIMTGWNEQGGGGIAWEATSHQWSKNACSNGPAAILATKLYTATQDGTYLEWAKNIFAWEEANLFNPATGAVYDNLNANSGELNTTTLSYNQGTFVGAANELYKLTGDAEYLNAARKAAFYCITNTSMIDTGNNVLRNEGTGDGGLFKGIFMRYFVQLILNPDLDANYRNKFTTFFNNNADVLWRQGVNKTDLLFGPSWTSPVIGTTQLTSMTSGCTLMEAKAYYENHKNEK